MSNSRKKDNVNTYLRGPRGLYAQNIKSAALLRSIYLRHERSGLPFYYKVTLQDPISDSTRLSTASELDQPPLVPSPSQRTMLIAIIGTRFSGKSTVEDYFIKRDFTQVRINESYELYGNTNHEVRLSELIGHPPNLIELEIIDLGLGSLPPRDVTTLSSTIEVNDGSKTAPPSLLSPTNPLSSNSNRTLRFASAPAFLQYVTKNWKTNFVTVDLYTKQMIEIFVKRPFFVLLSIDAPLYERFTRSQR